MGTARFFDEFALVGVDSPFIDEPLDLGVERNRGLDADTRAFYDNSIVLRKQPGSPDLDRTSTLGEPILERRKGCSPSSDAG